MLLSANIIVIFSTRSRYLVVKGALLKKGEPVLKTFRKFCAGPDGEQRRYCCATSFKESSVPSCSYLDNIFIANFYSSEHAETERYVNGGDLALLSRWEIDLGNVSAFRSYAANPHPRGIYIGQCAFQPLWR
jgi:hypothetical protein